jgi:outer membrane protein assembly factor BamB
LLSLLALACGARGGDAAAVRAEAPRAMSRAGAAPSSAEDEGARTGSSTGDLTTILSIPAWDAVLAAGHVVVLEPDFQTLSGHDATTGEMRWRTRMLEKTSGRHTLRARGNEVVFWAGKRMLVVDAATGARRSDEEVFWNGDCSFVERGAACAFACSCHLQLAACDTGKLIGTRFDKSYVEEWGPDGEPPHGGCYGMGTNLLAGTGRVSVVVVEDMRAPSLGRIGHPHVALGLDAKTGNEIWRVADPPYLSIIDEAPVTPDGKLVWLRDDNGTLRMLDAQTGKLRWSRPGLPELGRVPRHFFALLADPPGLFWYLEDEAVLHDLATGSALWRAKVPPGAFAIPAGERIPFYSVETHGDGPLELLLLDPRTGKEAGRTQVPASSMVHDDPAGGFYLLNEALTAFDAEGRKRAGPVPASPPNLHAERDFVTLFSKEELVILDRQDLSRVAGIRGSLAAMPGSALAGSILLYRWSDEKNGVGQATVVRRRR